MHRDQHLHYPVIHPTRYVFLSHPGEKAVIVGADITLIVHGDDAHFVIRTGVGQPVALPAGRESTNADRVIAAWSMEPIGDRYLTEFRRFVFYVIDGGYWRQVAFERESDMPGSIFMGCGFMARSEPVVLDPQAFGTPPADDDGADPFQYWWHAAMSEAALEADAAGQYAKARDEALGAPHPVTLTFGSLEFGACETWRVDFLYAVSRSILEARIAAIADTDAYRGRSAIYPGYRRRGWCAAVYVLKAVEHYGRLLPPGTHRLPSWDVENFAFRLPIEGCAVKALADGRRRAILEADLKLTTYEEEDGTFHGVLLGAGEHVFIADDRAFDDDDLLSRSSAQEPI